jgi:hypothetical protein
MCATPESFAGAAFGDAAAPGGSGADVPYRDAEPVVWVGWSSPPAVFAAAEAPAAGPNATTSPVQTAGTSSSRHLRRAAGGDPRPNLVEDFRDDQDVRMGKALPAHACRQSQAVPLADGHADVTVPRARRFRQNLTITANDRQRSAEPLFPLTAGS